jgi:hypothetical protein
MALSSLIALLLAMQAPGSPLERFFVGRTEGSGTVHVIMSGRHGVRDRSTGRMQGSTLVLDQVVEEEGKPARRRTWRLTRSGGNAVSGTISDARGPVTGELNGNTLTLRYSLTEGPSVVQTITLQAGGRSARNRMTFRRWGVNVATVETTVRRVN